MDTKAKISRKTFSKIMVGLITGSFLWVWYRLSDDRTEENNQSEVRHQGDIAQGVSHFGKYYLFRDGEAVLAFSTTCTHVGCRLGKTHSAVLQCGCHGSQFEAATGRPLRGPAIKSLQKHDCQYDATSNQWVVKLLQSSDSKSTS